MAHTGRHVAPKPRSGRLSGLAVGLIIGLIAAMSLPIGAASWDEKINGGSSYASPYGEFTVTLSAFQRSDGTYTGNGQYYFPGNGRTFHLEVDQVCWGNYDGALTAVAVGTVKGQDDTTVNVGWGGIAVRDVPEGADQFRVNFDVTETAIRSWCSTQANGSRWPATVVDGEFNIKSKG